MRIIRVKQECYSAGAESGFDPSGHEENSNENKDLATQSACFCARGAVLLEYDL
jgi:hypothetical protein